MPLMRFLFAARRSGREFRRHVTRDFQAVEDPVRTALGNDRYDIMVIVKWSASSARMSSLGTAVERRTPEDGIRSVPREIREPISRLA